VNLRNVNFFYAAEKRKFMVNPKNKNNPADDEVSRVALRLMGLFCTAALEFQ
jgi:hypothetical protein